MSEAVESDPIACPSCDQPMHAQDFTQNYSGSVRVNLCHPCGGIWFDHQGSSQLSPGAVIELFKGIHEHLEDPRRALAAKLRCPRCREELVFGWDLCRTGRFSYYRCLQGDGRFTPFFQFLREKQFVRDLTPPEIERVRAQVRQLHCSDCGAPIDLEHESQCPYCHAPVSFLDKDAVEKAMQMWSQAESRRAPRPSANAVAQALEQAHIPEAGAPPPTGARLGGLVPRMSEATPNGEDLAVDLIALGIRAIGRLLGS